MGVVTKSIVLTALGVGVVITAWAQNQSRNHQSTHSKVQARHHASSAAMPGTSKRTADLNKNLDQLEKKATTVSGSQRHVAKGAVASSGKSVLPQDRRSNPPINFAYKGPSNGSASNHRSNASRSSGSVVGPRMK